MTILLPLSLVVPAAIKFSMIPPFGVMHPSGLKLLVCGALNLRQNVLILLPVNRHGVTGLQLFLKVQAERQPLWYIRAPTIRLLGPLVTVVPPSVMFSLSIPRRLIGSTLAPVIKLAL